MTQVVNDTNNVKLPTTAIELNNLQLNDEMASPLLTDTVVTDKTQPMLTELSNNVMSITKNDVQSLLPTNVVNERILEPSTNIPQSQSQESAKEVNLPINLNVEIRTNEENSTMPLVNTTKTSNVDLSSNNQTQVLPVAEQTEQVELSQVQVQQSEQIPTNKQIQPQNNVSELQSQEPVQSVNLLNNNVSQIQQQPQTQIQTQQPIQQTQTQVQQPQVLQQLEVENEVQIPTNTNMTESMPQNPIQTTTQSNQPQVNVVNLTSDEVQPQSQNVEQQVVQNQPTQNMTYVPVRQTPQVVEQPTQFVENTQELDMTIEEIPQPVYVTQNQVSQSNQIIQQNQAQVQQVGQQPQLQAAVAETQVSEQQPNLINVPNSEFVDNAQVVIPNQENQNLQQQTQQQSQQQNLQSNAQQFQTTEVEVEETTQNQSANDSFVANLGAATNNLNTQNVQQPTTTQVTQEQPATTLQQDFNITGQIVEHAKMIRTAQNTEMVIHLKPEHLGELTLKISVTSNGSVNASFHSDNAAVRAMIENTVVHLKQELANQGLKVDSVQVYSGLDGNLMNGRGQQAWQQNQQSGNSRQGRRIDFAKLDEEIAERTSAATPVNNVANSDGVDYRV